MNRFYFAVIIAFTAPSLLFAQNEIQSYGKVDIKDLELKECSFEKDANAMVLFDVGDVYYDDRFNVIKEEHNRIKIFNEKAKDIATIRIEYYSYNDYQTINSISAQTINLKNGNLVITKVDKKQIFKEVVDKYRTAIVFSFPDVQPGSIIEYKYKLETSNYSNLPSWEFQSSIPTRYTELKTSIPSVLIFNPFYKIDKVFDKTKSSSETKFFASGGGSYNNLIKTVALKDVPSFKSESYMTSKKDNIQHVSYELIRIEPIGGFTINGLNTWQKIAAALIDDDDFGRQFKKKLDGEEILISKAKALKTDEEKISFLFNEVKSLMKWNNRTSKYTNEGISKSWQTKTGNSAEINLILYHLLKQSEVNNIHPMLVSTRENGKANPYSPSLSPFNNTVVYIPVDSVKYYILDATEKHNLYTTIPYNYLNSHGIYLDKENKTCKNIFITSLDPSIKRIYISAEIAASGKMAGVVSMNEVTYHKINTSKAYKKDGEEEYKNSLTDKDNNLKIKSLKMENIEIDSLPLKETIDFELELSGSGDNYLYFTPTMFSGLRNNPFVSENRNTSIDMGYNKKYFVSGSFKLPEGYKVDVLPKNINFVMPDKSITFQRIIQETESNIVVRYVIDFKKSLYPVKEYPELRAFYKQMLEMLNEQIVLKKS